MTFRDDAGPFDPNPLVTDEPGLWDRLIESAGPARLLVAIDSRLGEGLRNRLAVEDIWQETLFQAWRDRDRFTWNGVRSFRRWLLSIAENRIRDAADRESAECRGGGRSSGSLPCADPSDSSARLPDGMFPGPAGSTTPSRIAIHREEAAAVRAALSRLPDDVREIMWLRHIEGLEGPEIAERLGIPLSTVKHRFRRGAVLFMDSYPVRPGTGILGGEQ